MGYGLKISAAVVRYYYVDQQQKGAELLSVHSSTVVVLYVVVAPPPLLASCCLVLLTLLACWLGFLPESNCFIWIPIPSCAHSFLIERESLLPCDSLFIHFNTEKISWQRQFFHLKDMSLLFATAVSPCTGTIARDIDVHHHQQTAAYHNMGENALRWFRP